MPIDVHPAFQHIKDELEAAERDGRKVEAKVIGTAKKVEAEISGVEAETK